MTTTTADKGELLPLPEPAQWFIDVTTNGRSTGRYEVCAEEYRDSESVVPLFTAEKMREYALANMNRAIEQRTAQSKALDELAAQAQELGMYDTPAGEGVGLRPTLSYVGDGKEGRTIYTDLTIANVEIAKRDAEIERLSLDLMKANNIKIENSEAALMYRIADLQSQLTELRQGGEVVGTLHIDTDTRSGNKMTSDFTPSRDLDLEDGDYQLYTRPQPAIAEYNYAKQIAESLHLKLWSDANGFAVCDTLMGVLTQIDNMTCSLVKPTSAIPPGYVVPDAMTFLCDNDLAASDDWMQGWNDCRAMLASAPAIQPQAVVPTDEQDGMLKIRTDVVEFLRGAGLLCGCEFGERPVGAKGEFWWRKFLPAASADSKEGEK